MEIKRLKHTIRLWFILGANKRTNYLKANNVFAFIGENCSIMDRKVPLYANLIRIGNNVHIASKVDMITHDIAHVMLNNNPYALKKSGGVMFQENIGCIEIGDNVFIGTNTTILGNVKIGNNVIVAAGTLVNKDVPNDSVVAGVPCKVVNSFDSFVDKRVKQPKNVYSVINQRVSEEMADYYWKEFLQFRKE